VTQTRSASSREFVPERLRRVEKVLSDPRASPAHRAVYEVGRKIADDVERLLFYYDGLKKADRLIDLYEEVPVGPREFMESPRYLNKPVSAVSGDSLWPENAEEYVRMNSGDFEEAVLTGGIGTGKTSVALFGTAYQLYRLLILRSPHRLFGLMSSDEIIMIFQSVNATKAKGLDYRRFRNLVGQAPFFKGTRYDFDRGLESTMVFRNHLVVKPVNAEDTAIIGENVIGGIMDEVNFLDVVEESKRSLRMTGETTFDQAMQNYRAIIRRRESRFMDVKGTLPGMLYLVSSRQYPGEFTDKRIAERDEELTRFGRSKTYVYDRRRWEVDPKLMSNQEWFDVFVGDEARKPRIMGPGDELSEEDEKLRLRVPEVYRRGFEKDMLGMLRDVGGVSTLALHPFITDREGVDAAFGSVQSVLSATDCDFTSTKVKIFPGRFRHVNDPVFPRAVHIDLAISGDSAGVSCGCVPEFTYIDRGHGSEVETLPVVEFDFTLEVRPPRGGEILIYRIRELLYKLRDLGLPIRWVSLDSFQSRDTLQVLRKQNFTTGLLSVDADMGPYTHLKSAILDGRLRVPRHDKAKMELLTLEWNLKKKTVDHRPNGSKDVSDSMAGVVHTLTTRRMVWAQHGVLGRIPRSLAMAREEEQRRAA
jgi:hypothetical protein